MPSVGPLHTTTLSPNAVHLAVPDHTKPTARLRPAVFERMLSNTREVPPTPISCKPHQTRGIMRDPSTSYQALGIGRRVRLTDASSGKAMESAGGRQRREDGTNINRAKGLLAHEEMLSLRQENEVLRAELREVRKAHTTKRARAADGDQGHGGVGGGKGEKCRDREGKEGCVRQGKISRSRNNCIDGGVVKHDLHPHFDLVQESLPKNEFEMLAARCDKGTTPKRPRATTAIISTAIKGTAITGAAATSKDFFGLGPTSAFTRAPSRSVQQDAARGETISAPQPTYTYFTRTASAEIAARLDDMSF